MGKKSREVLAKLEADKRARQARKDACPLHGPDPDDAINKYDQWRRVYLRRDRAGEHTRQCPGCGLYVWERLFVK